MLAEILEDKGEFELKYTFPNHASSMLGSWLACSCKTDREFPESRVQSIYFESLTGSSYDEKANSDFFKTKYRVRWYETDGSPLADEDGNVQLFLEKKMKVGAKRLKNRWVESAQKQDIMSTSLSSAFHNKWHEILSEKEGEVVQHCQPFIQVSYTRKRFVDSFTGARLSLDYDIQVEKSNELLLPPPTREVLPTGVFEVKGDSDSPPKTIHFLTKSLVRKANFSKYENCVSFLTSNI